jgi:hypothetical protein
MRDSDSPLPELTILIAMAKQPRNRDLPAVVPILIARQA